MHTLTSSAPTPPSAARARMLPEPPIDDSRGSQMTRNLRLNGEKRDLRPNCETRNLGLMAKSAIFGPIVKRAITYFCTKNNMQRNVGQCEVTIAVPFSGLYPPAPRGH